MSLQKPKVGRTRCKRAAIHCSRWRSSGTLGWNSRVTEDGTGRLIHGFVENTQY